MTKTMITVKMSPKALRLARLISASTGEKQYEVFERVLKNDAENLCLLIRSKKMLSFDFTAINATQLDKQIAQANKLLSENGSTPITVVVGKAKTAHKLWYVYGEYGSNLKDKLVFADAVKEVQKRFSEAFEFINSNR